MPVGGAGSLAGYGARGGARTPLASSRKQTPPDTTAIRHGWRRFPTKLCRAHARVTLCRDVEHASVRIIRAASVQPDVSELVKQLRVSGEFQEIAGT